MKNKKTNAHFHITLGSFNIEVRVDNGARLVRYKDTEELLGLSPMPNKNFVDAKVVTDVLYSKIYKDETATIEQREIFDALCIVGIYSLIDEACNVDLSKVSYKEEFLKNIQLKDSLKFDKEYLTKGRWVFYNKDTNKPSDDILVDISFKDGQGERVAPAKYDSDKKCFVTYENNGITSFEIKESRVVSIRGL